MIRACGTRVLRPSNHRHGMAISTAPRERRAREKEGGGERGRISRRQGMSKGDWAGKIMSCSALHDSLWIKCRDLGLGFRAQGLAPCTTHFGKFTPSARLMIRFEGIFGVATATCTAWSFFLLCRGSWLAMSADCWAIVAALLAACISSLALYAASAPEAATCEQIRGRANSGRDGLDACMTEGSSPVSQRLRSGGPRPWAS